VGASNAHCYEIGSATLPVGFQRAPSSQVALHRALIAHRSVVWVLVKLSTAAAKVNPQDEQ
jgi:hypothetical protein